MIPISLTTAILVYSTMLAAIFMVLYLYTEQGARRSERILAQQFRWRCTYCGYTYLDEAAVSASQCPRCNSINNEVEGRPRELRAHDSEPTPDETEDFTDTRRNPSHRKRPNQKRRGPRRH